MAVVTAGAKAILDLGLTLETLETLGVPVVGFGTDEFPAFYSRRVVMPFRCVVTRQVMVARLMRPSGNGIARWNCRGESHTSLRRDTRHGN